MTIIGIDPGTATTGWGIVRFDKTKQSKYKSGRWGKIYNGSLELVDFGCILTNSEDEMPKRLLVIKTVLMSILKKYSPDSLVAERLFFGVNSRTAMAVGQARGVVMLASAESKIDFYEYTGLEVKLEVANHGRSDKKTVQLAVKRYLRVTNLRKPTDQNGKVVNRFRDDAYDAVAVAICHLSKQKLLG